MLGRKPMFPGKNFVDQLTLIFNVLGTPSTSEIARIKSSQAQRFLQSLSKKTKISMTTIFPSASSEAINLLENLLQFNPKKRSTVDEALAHPYFSPLQKQNKSTVISPCVDELDLHFERENLSREALRLLILQDAKLFRDNGNGKAKARPARPATASSSRTKERTGPTDATSTRPTTASNTISKKHTLKKEALKTVIQTKTSGKEGIAVKTAESVKTKTLSRQAALRQQTAFRPQTVIGTICKASKGKDLIRTEKNSKELSGSAKPLDTGDDDSKRRKAQNHNRVEQLPPTVTNLSPGSASSSSSSEDPTIHSTVIVSTTATKFSFQRVKRPTSATPLFKQRAQVSTSSTLAERILKMERKEVPPQRSKSTTCLQQTVSSEKRESSGTAFSLLRRKSSADEDTTRSSKQQDDVPSSSKNQAFHDPLARIKAKKGTRKLLTVPKSPKFSVMSWEKTFQKKKKPSAVEEPPKRQKQGFTKIKTLRRSRSASALRAAIK